MTARAAGVFLAALALVFHPSLDDGFELPKAILLRTGSLALLWLFFWRRPKDSPPPEAGGLDRPMAAYLGIAALFTLASIHPHLSFFGQYRHYAAGLWSLLSCGILYWLVSRLPPEPAQKALFYSLLTAGTIAVAFALAQRMGLDPFPWSEAARARPIASFGSPFKFAPFLALLVPVVLSAYWSAPAGPRRVFLLIFFLLAVFELISTLGRGAWLGTLAGVALWTAINWEDVRRQRSRIGWLAALAAIAIVGLGLFGERDIQDRMAVFLNRHEGSAANRLELWRMALRMIVDAKGWGRGLDVFGLLSPAYETPAFRTGVGVQEIATNAHNEVLEVAVTMGALGVAAYLWLWGSFFKRGWTAARSAPQGQRLVASGLLCGAVAFWIYSQFNFGTTATCAYAWAIMGALAGPGVAAAASRAPSSRPTRAIALVVVAALAAGAAYDSARLCLADQGIKKMKVASRWRQWLKAAEHGERALAMDPWSAQSAMLLVNAYRNIAQVSTTKEDKSRWFAKASGVFKDHLRRYPQDPDAHHNYAMTLMWRALEVQEPVIEEALSEEREAIARAPLFPDFWSGLGQMSHFAGRIEDAKRAWVRAIDISPGFAPALDWLEKYTPRDVFTISPSDLEVADVELGRPVALDREKRLVVKIANTEKRPLSFKIDVVSAPWHPVPPGYVPSSVVRLSSRLSEIEISGDSIAVIPLEIFVPAHKRFRGKSFCLFLRLRCTTFDVPIDRIVRVLIRTQGAPP